MPFFQLFFKNLACVALGAAVAVEGGSLSVFFPAQAQTKAQAKAHVQAQAKHALDLTLQNLKIQNQNNCIRI